ncbi:MAG: hypothetical protein R3191_04830 [Anaerolineales bacterium]|nr:hypothetical protein [Anaerolineales bacterium]
MGRPITPEEYKQLVARAREAIPGLAVTTDIILGFPGETQREFNESLAYIERLQFADAHVFPFSPRPGTAAMNLPDRVHSRVAKRRAKRVRDAVANSAKTFRKSFIGEELTVLWENAEALDARGWRMSGLSDNYLRVQAHTEQDLWNQLTRVRIESSDDSTLAGTPLATNKGSPGELR